MNIKRVLAAIGVVAALAPAALGAMLVSGKSEGGGVVLKKPVSADLTLNELGGLMNSPGERDTAEEATTAEAKSRQQAGILAPVIFGDLDEKRLGSNLVNAGGVGEKPSSDSAGDLAVPLGDPMLPPASELGSATRGGNGAPGGALSGTANSVRARGVSGSGSGGGSGAAGGVVAAGIPGVEAQGSPASAGDGAGTPGLEAAAQIDMMPTEPPVPASQSSIKDSVAALDEPIGDRKADDIVLATPLPKSLWMLFAAMVGLALLARRRVPS